MAIESLYENVPLPLLARVRRRYAHRELSDVAGTVWKELEYSGLSGRLKPGGTVAVGVGSRGISHLPEIVAAVVDWFKKHGTRPFIVPSMGSHGGATSEGQKSMLANLGVTEERVGCPVLSDMDARCIGSLKFGHFQDQKVYFDSYALQADSIFFVCRVKCHTGFKGPHESGFCKMLTIGFGKQKGAESCHKLGLGVFPELMPAMAEFVLGTLPQILGGVGCVEDAYGKTSIVKVALHEDILAEDARLLRIAKSYMPSLPLKNLHVLTIDRMGKNISGPGMDPNITGRFIAECPTDIHINIVSVHDLTQETEGNANGVGAADFITRRLFEKCNFNYTYMNCLTGPLVRNAMIPVMLPHDRAVFSMAVKKGNPFDEDIKVVRIRDTMTLDRFLASPAVLEQIRDKEEYQILDEPQPVMFREDGAFFDWGEDFWNGSCWTEA